jgi:hypothetical protein
MWSTVKVTALILLAFVVCLPRPCAAQANADDIAKMLFDSANQERTSRGIPALKWDASLAAAAQRHAERMANENTLSHQFPGEPDLAAREKQAGANFSAAAENVALGPTAAAIHAGWMHSPPHRHNLLDPQFNSIGIAVIQRNGTLWAVEDFSRALPSLSLPDQEKTVAAPLRAAGLTIRADDSNARRVCEGGSVGSARPLFIEQFSTTDLSTLPASLQSAIKSGQYISAEIGACTKPATNSLSQYHIAVLLY